MNLLSVLPVSDLFVTKVIYKQKCCNASAELTALTVECRGQTIVPFIQLHHRFHAAVSEAQVCFVSHLNPS